MYAYTLEYTHTSDLPLKEWAAYRRPVLGLFGHVPFG